MLLLTSLLTTAHSEDLLLNSEATQETIVFIAALTDSAVAHLFRGCLTCRSWSYLLRHLAGWLRLV